MTSVQPAVGAKSKDEPRFRARLLGPGWGDQSRGGEILNRHDDGGHVGSRREELLNLRSQFVALSTPPGYFGLHCLELAADDLNGSSGRGLLGNGS
jgi:hypothetical protein